MKLSALPRDVVDGLLRAGNARDIEAYCSLFADDAVLSNFNNGQELARGIEEIRARYAARFERSKAHCDVMSRIELGCFVVDHERVTEAGAAPIDVIAILEVRQSLIRSVRFIWP